MRAAADAEQLHSALVRPCLLMSQFLANDRRILQAYGNRLQLIKHCQIHPASPMQLVLKQVLVPRVAMQYVA